MYLCNGMDALHVEYSEGEGRKNKGRLWLAYTELQGDFYMLQLMTDDSGHFNNTHTSNM